MGAIWRARGQKGCKNEPKGKKNHALLETLSALMGHYFLSVFCVSLRGAVLLNCCNFGLHLEVILGAFCSTLAIVKTVVLLRENIDLAPFGRSRWAAFSKTSFWRRPGSTFDDFWLHLESHWESICAHFSAFWALDFQSDFGANVYSVLGRGRLQGQAPRTCKNLQGLQEIARALSEIQSRPAPRLAGGRRIS